MILALIPLLSKTANKTSWNLHKHRREKMEMEISFPEGKKVDSHFKGFSVHTDQPQKAGGDGTAPSPTELFLASIGTCAGYFALIFCDKRKLNTDKLNIKLDFQANKKTYMIENIIVKITLPSDFPEKYKEALIKAVDLCHVKKHFTDPPKFEYLTTTAE
jgi:ribosomal protein S12 methylthiotransferase accessory factor